MMTSELTYLFAGVVLGLSGGLSPGPLLTLVVSETLKHGPREGVKVSVAPLLTDLPIVFFTLFLLSRLSDIHLALGIISLLGGGFLAYLGYESIAFKGADMHVAPVRPQSLRKGVIANFLNPSPYLFWFSIGGPMVIKAYAHGRLPAGLFVLCFYALLVGSKVLLAVAIGKSRLFLRSRHYVYTIRALGVLLFLFAALFLKDGLQHFV